MTWWEIHPALVHIPLTLLLAATVLDVVAFVRRRESLVRLAAAVLVAGIIAALVAASAGLLAYFTVPPHTERAHVRILLHAVTAAGAAVLYGVVLVLHARPRAQTRPRLRMGVSLAAAAVLTAAGALGGYLVYHDGVGVKTAHSGEVEGNWAFHWRNLLGE